VITLSSLLLSLLLFTGTVSEADQQQPNRIVLSIPGEGFTPNEQQLAIAAELEITLFEISTPRMAELLDESEFRFFLDIGHPYVVPGKLSEESGEMISTLDTNYRNLRQTAADRILAVSIFKYPFETHPNFNSRAEAVADSVSAFINEPLYYHSILSEGSGLPAGFNFVSVRHSVSSASTADTPFIHFEPSDDRNKTYSKLNALLTEIQQLEEPFLVLPAPWFFSELSHREELRYIFADFISGEAVTFPLPADSPDPPFMNWSVVLLLAIWGSFALHYRFQPIYSQSMIRYFTNHTFFVTDVIENRLRNILPGLYLLIQHALLTGLFVYACAEVVVSPPGLKVLSHHFPGLMIIGTPLFSLFLTGILTAVILQTLSVIWIYLANKNLTSFSQILNLYSWPLHLNLIVVTFLIVFNQVGFDEIWIFILSALFILIWFFSFNIAAIDSSKFLDDGRFYFLTGTIGVHIILMLGALIYLLNTPSLLEPLLFAISIP